MTLGCLMVDVAGRSLLPEDRDVLEHPLVGGVILFTRNYESPAQLAALVAEIRALRRPPLLVAVDHEGGRVQRFRPGFTLLPPMRRIGREYEMDRARGRLLAREAGWLSGAELRAVGIEGDAALVARARGNAALNGITNARFAVANLFGPLTAETWARERYQRVLLDPPRAGALEVLPLVAASGATRVVYISCHPASFARDAGILVNEHGFKLAAAGVMDMFPHTAHIESIAVFERKK